MASSARKPAGAHKEVKGEDLLAREKLLETEEWKLHESPIIAVQRDIAERNRRKEQANLAAKLLQEQKKRKCHGKGISDFLGPVQSHLKIHQ